MSVVTEVSRAAALHAPQLSAPVVSPVAREFHASTRAPTPSGGAVLDPEPTSAFFHALAASPARRFTSSFASQARGSSRRPDDADHDDYVYEAPPTRNTLFGSRTSAAAFATEGTRRGARADKEPFATSSSSSSSTAAPPGSGTGSGSAFGSGSGSGSGSGKRGGSDEEDGGAVPPGDVSEQSHATDSAARERDAPPSDAGTAAETGAAAGTETGAGSGSGSESSGSGGSGTEVDTDVLADDDVYVNTRAPRRTAADADAPARAGDKRVNSSSSSSSSSGSGAKSGSSAPWVEGGGGGAPGDSSSTGAAGGNGSGGDSKAVVPHGVNAPKLSSVIALPSASRPLFPGLYYPLVIKDERLVRQLMELRKRSLPYVGVFLKKVTKEDDFAKGKSHLDSVVLGQPPIPLPAEDAPTTSCTLDEIHRVGTFAQVYRISKLEKGGYSVILVGLRRCEILSARAEEPFLSVNIRHVDEPTPANRRFAADGSLRSAKDLEEEENVIRTYSTEIIATLKECIKNNFIFHEQLSFLLNNVDWSNPATLADVCATFTTADAGKLQEVLASYDVVERLSKTLLLLRKEIELSRMQQDLSKQMNDSMKKIHRKNMLHEQLKLIKRELGLEKEDKDELGSKFSERLKDKTVPAEIQAVFEDELLKFQRLEQSSMEFNLTRNYLDWLSSMPWGVYSEQCFDLARAENVLNEDHYGMEDIKDRIMEFIAVGKLLNQTPQGKIMLFVGPPGVGKTSIGKSIARALGREFYRFSVGGMNDVAEVKGHRRTYVGAMPGKLVQALKKTNCANPVILIDEVDKIGRGGSQGDPSSALLEVLDPEQNASFLDHYMDVPIDLSKVLFLCTANVLESIPGPLLDRMDVIRLSGYVTQEKEHIAKNYLEPTVRTKVGIAPEQASISVPAIHSLIKWYCREAGVRNLQKHIEKIYRRVAFAIVKGTPTPITVGVKDLTDYVGQQAYTTERLYPRTPVGVVMGLAWSASGGAVLYLESELSDAVRVARRARAEGGDVVTIASRDADAAADAAAAAAGASKGSNKAESKADDDEDEDGGKGGKKSKGGPGNGALHVTGQLGDVMKESSSIAYTLAKAYLGRLVTEGAAIRARAAAAGQAVKSVPTVESAPLPPLRTREPTLKQSKRMTLVDKTTKVSAPTAFAVGGATTDAVSADSAASAPMELAKPVEPATGGAKAVAAAPAVAAPQASAVAVADGEADADHDEFVGVDGSRAPALPAAAPLDPAVAWVTDVPSPSFFADHHLHVHFPQGAVPKDGPSAGIALVCCLLSQALDRPLVPDLAMTGEITLTGKVLPIGGVKEKVIAARRAGVNHIIAPLANLKDFAELPGYISAEMTVYFCDSYEEVFRVAFGLPYAFNGADAAPTYVKVFPREEVPEANPPHLPEAGEAAAAATAALATAAAPSALSGSADSSSSSKGSGSDSDAGSDTSSDSSSGSGSSGSDSAAGNNSTSRSSSSSSSSSSGGASASGANSEARVGSSFAADVSSALRTLFGRPAPVTATAP
jgi:Lon-like ATP-dependent protease